MLELRNGRKFQVEMSVKIKQKYQNQNKKSLKTQRQEAKKTTSYIIENHNFLMEEKYYAEENIETNSSQNF